MATFSRIKVWTPEVLTSNDLNAEFDNIIANMTPTGIEDASANVAAMQSNTDPGGVGSENLATNLLGEVERIRFALKRIINGAQWYSTPVGSLSTGGISTAAIADAAVSTVKIADGAVTYAKRSALNSVSLNVSNTIIFSDTISDISTNLTITTTGRPILVGLYPRVNGTPSYIGGRSVAQIALTNGAASTTYALWEAGSSVDAEYPASSFTTIIDTLAAGTHTLKIRGNLLTAGVGNQLEIQNIVLRAIEL